MAGRQALIVPALKKHSATIIMAHGLGDSGAGWVSLAESWRRRGKFEDVKFIFPNAPNIPITVNFGMSMPGWYDIVRRRDDVCSPHTSCRCYIWLGYVLTDFLRLQSDFSDLNQQQDESGIFRSRSTFTKLITDEVAAGIPSNRIILGGFSQGGAMSLFTGVTTPHKLGGVFGLSCYLVLADKIKELAKEASDANKDTAFFMGHGDADEVVKYRWGQRTAEMLKNELGHKVEFKTYK